MSNVEIKLEMEDILNEDANDTKNDLPCDDEDLPPDMIPTEPEKKEFVWPEVTKCNVIGFVICGLCIAFFTILFFCSYFIPRSEYLDAKKQNPDHDFLEMQTTPLALYWTYYCCIMVLLFSLPFLFYFECEFPILLVAVVFFGSAVLVFCIVSPMYIRNDSYVDKAISYQTPYSTYESDINATINELPYLEVGFFGFSSQKKKKFTYYYYCDPPRVRINVANASTSYNLPELGDYAWTQIYLNATYPEGVEEYVNTFRERYRKYLPSKDQAGLKITWTDISGFKTKSYDSSLRLITRKKLEGGMSPAVGQTMIAFWAGLGYIYRLMTIPFYRPVINKFDIEISNASVEYIPEEGDEFFQLVSSVRCD